MDRVRIDKWLWAARFFKTRALAARACDLGRIQSNGIDAKPARHVQAGDRLTIRTGVNDYEVEVLALSEMRGPAAAAQALYRESESSIERRRIAAEQRKSEPRFDGIPSGRPSKRDRRELDRFRRSDE
ncbi:MAG TPA: RNA-binding S4 domain-containing protein [Bryobacteraceae bacterium]|nr:RNA-binding S4 domain-containing protein [Bryobacteraceae bacterium]HPT25816.1 RNA-binding S4 domain-containing protein [Bryobacteraceae bacterium]